VGAFVASFLGKRSIGYKAGESAGFIGSVVGAIIVLVITALLPEATSGLNLSTHPNNRARGSWGKLSWSSVHPNRMTGTRPQTLHRLRSTARTKAVPSHPANARGVRPGM